MKLEEENKGQLLEYAMQAGLLLGTFWVFKYLFVIFGANHPAINTVGSILSLGTPILLFYLLVKYNASRMNNLMRYWQGVRFSVLLFFFASILEAFVVFIHVRWIDPTFIANLYENMVELAQAFELSKTLTAQLADQPLPDPFSYIFSNVIMANVFLGLVLSLVVVPFVLRYKPRQNN